MKEICNLLDCFIDDFAIIHIEGKGVNCINSDGELLLPQFYSDIQIVEKKVGRTREDFSIQVFLLVRDKDTQLYGLFDSALNELFPVGYEHIELIGSFLRRDDPMPSQVISAKYPNRGRWKHVDLITGCSYENDSLDSMNAVYDNFHCFCGFESNHNLSSKCPSWLGYEARLPDADWTYDENSYWDSNKHIFYIINPVKGTAVSFQSDAETLWKTLNFGEWDSANKNIISPVSFMIPDDWCKREKEIGLCDGFKLKIECDCDGLWSMTLIEDRCPLL